MNRYGFVRIAVGAPEVSVGDPKFNADRINDFVHKVPADIHLLPELSITGYSCGDLFGQKVLLDEAWLELTELAARLPFKSFVVVGVPVMFNDLLYNCAAVLHGNEVVGLVPKQYLPNYKEFYEKRWFASGLGMKAVDNGIPFGTDMLFSLNKDAVVGIELCEDGWSATPPSGNLALAGANIILNPSASNELVGKSQYRRSLFAGQSGRCIAAYAYASSGWMESTSDVVFGGHCFIAENGSILAESKKFERSSFIVTDVDIERLSLERARTSSFADAAKRHNDTMQVVDIQGSDEWPYDDLLRRREGHPFVPTDNVELHDRCEEIFGIQTRGLAKRLEFSKTKNMVLGVSGGLDSALSLLVAAKSCDLAKMPRDSILGITMPGFGTTKRTYDNAYRLMKALGVGRKEIDIRGPVLDALRDIGHHPFGIDISDMSIEDFVAQIGALKDEDRHDVVFENVQARLRTFYLMSHGFVVGTGDMSEMALGWATYNGDHMSMYNPNCSIPKTLVRFLVKYVAKNETDLALRTDASLFREDFTSVLTDIADTPISPELLPKGPKGEATQDTEAIVGPYELHDFFLFNMVRNGFGPAKILFLAEHALFDKDYDREEIAKWLTVFYKRFFANQFKRDCVPNGPKVGTVSLSPRGDWRMPSDASVEAWLRELKDAFREER